LRFAWNFETLHVTQGEAGSERSRPVLFPRIESLVWLPLRAFNWSDDTRVTTVEPTKTLLKIVVTEPLFAICMMKNAIKFVATEVGFPISDSFVDPDNIPCMVSNSELADISLFEASHVPVSTEMYKKMNFFRGLCPF